MFIQNLLISQPRHFCQGIDKVMLIRSVLFNFQGAFLNSVVLISQATLLLYHIFLSLSRGFLNFFQSFFQTNLVSFKKWLSFRKLLYYITFALVCQEVFKTFFKVFCDLFAFVCLIAECLYIISPFFAKVNTFLRIFSILLQLYCIIPQC